MIEPLKLIRCDLCIINFEPYLTMYLNKTKPVREIVNDLVKEHNIPCSLQKFYNHIRYHVGTQVQPMLSNEAPELVEYTINKFKELGDSIERLKNKIKTISDTINAEASPQLINAYVNLERELRASLETIARLSGDLKQSEHIHIKNMNIEYNAVFSQILQNTCNNCKLKLSKILESENATRNN